MISDSFAYLPLLVATGAAFITIIILAANRERYHPVVLALHILCALLVSLVALYTVVNPMILPMAAALASCAILMLAAAVTDRLTKPKESRTATAQEAADGGEDAQAADGAGRLLEAGKSFTLAAADAIARGADIGPMLDLVNESLIRQTDAHGGAILLVDGFEDVLAVRTLSGDFPPPYRLPDDLPHKALQVDSNFRLSRFPLTQTIFSTVARSGKGELIADAPSDSRIVQNGPEDFLKCGSYIFTPIKATGTVVGVAALARRHGEAAFTERAYNAACLLSDCAGAAIKAVYSCQEVMEHAELTKEAHIACRLQATLPPKLLPAIPGLSLGAFQRFADGICGDYYDVIPARRDRVSFVLGDVAGKGMTSLMVMVMLRAMLRLTVNTTQTAATILSWVNRGIAGETSMDHFASVALINYDTERRKIQIATGGSAPILLYHAASGTVQQISVMGDPVGVEKRTEYHDREFSLSSGDILVTYTDGVVEATNSRGVQYSQERLLEVVTRNRQLSGKEIAERVKSDIVKFTGLGPQHDDQTLLVIKVH